ncbi:glycosyltransferase family 4 protein [Cognatishimia sp. MH4019]|uniref:glycosyltransferase family 4 protein n=1 Tax=Cognatishimia sp. MH4019 TaxID=2854030 RepID=UPI001CD2E34F|nr:glycosyltransferase family 4 protein [Cognatishimia sp. MH4019]
MMLQSVQRPPVVLFPYVGGDDIGGSHISSFKLIKALKDRGTAQPVVGVHRMEGDFLPFMADFDVTPVDLSGMPILSASGDSGTRTKIGALRWLSRSVPRMREFLRKHQIDVVHTNDGRMHASWAMPTALSKARMLWHHRSDPQARGVNLLAPVFADHLVTVSRFAAPAKPIRPIDHKWTVVHSPFDPVLLPDRDAAKRDLLATLGAPEGTHVLGYFGGLIPRKRPVHFVDAVADFIDAHPEMPTVGVLFGTVPSRGPALDDAARARAVERGIADRIHLMGFRSPVEPFMAGTDILLVSAHDEPFGRTLIEAMHLGTIVIATDHGGNPEAIRHGKTGFLVDPDDPSAFIDPIHKVLTDASLRAELRAHAKDHAMTHLTLDTHVDQIEAVYAKLLAKAPVT